MVKHVPFDSMVLTGVLVSEHASQLLLQSIPSYAYVAAMVEVVDFGLMVSINVLLSEFASQLLLQSTSLDDITHTKIIKYKLILETINK